MLIDEARIFVRSGKGGDGCVSLRREKFVPKGGPDGGDGGRGGDVVLVADPHLDTLLPFRHAPHHKAKNGEQGSSSSKHGSNGADCRVHVPLGTLVKSAENGDLLADISEPGMEVVIAKGGRGGFGNEHFKSATNQTPRNATPGGDCEELTLLLELKLIADVGLLGMPNAGKSTLLSAVSRARPKIADYPFTTLAPQPGIAELPGERRIVIADIPGLIKGAAAGAGLGHEFLRHVERTHVLVHLVDPLPLDGGDPAEHYAAIRQELKEFDLDLATKPELIVISKIDLIPEDDRAEFLTTFAKALDRDPAEIRMISSATHEGLEPLLEALWQVLLTVRDEEESSRSGW